MVKLGENEKHVKYVEKHASFTKSGGISKSRGNKNFPKYGEFEIHSQ